MNLEFPFHFTYTANDKKLTCVAQKYRSAKMWWVENEKGRRVTKRFYYYTANKGRFVSPALIGLAAEAGHTIEG